ncbi:MAG TPA: hypothetical protein VGG71_12485 [Chitinophagaceae bacterium]
MDKQSKVIQIVSHGAGLYALTDDGKIWRGIWQSPNYIWTLMNSPPTNNVENKS